MDGGGRDGAEEELTMQEMALYDLQIRVWGVDIQNRCAILQRTHVLLLLLHWPSPTSSGGLAVFPRRDCLATARHPTLLAPPRRVAAWWLRLSRWARLGARLCIGRVLEWPPPPKQRGASAGKKRRPKPKKNGHHKAARYAVSALQKRVVAVSTSSPPTPPKKQGGLSPPRLKEISKIVDDG